MIDFMSGLFQVNLSTYSIYLGRLYFEKWLKMKQVLKLTIDI